MELIDKVQEHNQNAENLSKECELQIENESESDRNQRIKLLSGRIKLQEEEYQHIIHVINIKLINIDNAINRHNTCSRDKCLRRKDGTICTTCK